MKALFALCLSLLFLTGCEAKEEEAQPPVQDVPVVEIPAKPESEKPKEEPKVEEKSATELLLECLPNLKEDIDAMAAADPLMPTVKGVQRNQHDYVTSSDDYYFLNSVHRRVYLLDGQWHLSGISIHDSEGELLKNYPHDDSYPGEESHCLQDAPAHMGDGIFCVASHGGIFFYNINDESLTLMHDLRHTLPDHKFAVYYGLQYGGRVEDAYVYLVTHEGENVPSQLFKIDKEGNVTELCEDANFSNLHGKNDMVLAYKPSLEGDRICTWYYNFEGVEGSFQDEYHSNPIDFYEIDGGWRYICDDWNTKTFYVTDIMENGEIVRSQCYMDGDFSNEQLKYIAGKPGEFRCYYWDNHNGAYYCFDQSTNEKLKIGISLNKSIFK